VIEADDIRLMSEALAADPRLAPVVEGWNLLGDPALWIAPPPPQRR